MTWAAVSTGMASTTSHTDIRSSHTNIGIRPKVMPGQRMVMMVAMRLMDPAMLPNPLTMQAEHPVVGARPRGERLLGQRCVGEPSDRGGRPGAVQSGTQEVAAVEQQPAEEGQPEAERVEAREGHVARPDHERHQVVGRPEHEGHPHEEHHGGAVHGEQPVEGIGPDQGVAGHGELPAHHRSLEAGDHEEDEGHADVHDPDPLVVDGEDPLVEERRRAVGPPRSAPSVTTSTVAMPVLPST